MSKRYWLMKTEPSTFSIDELARLGTSQWEGVRNYQARNFMRDDMRVGDCVLIYHSNATPPGIVGLATVCREGYPDYFAQDIKSTYFDPKSTPEKPIWFMVDVAFDEKFSRLISLEELKADPALYDMLVVQRGSRLSIQPVSETHFLRVLSYFKTEK
ncbi:MAG: EVE domain-containing protein [Candidatus Margulisbacteria bacterium]|nr:EVE domain-containing protein [Candidatus Margulisiibacteriota bacterium]